MSNTPLDEIFVERSKAVESIFSSYRELFDMYTSVLKTAHANPNSIQAFESAKKSAENKQIELSEKLYSQGLVLLSGVAEALLKEVYRYLILENFRKLKGLNGINFSVVELQEMLEQFGGRFFENDRVGGASMLLGEMVADKIFKSKNPTEKINLQNVQTMNELFKKHFEIDIQKLDVNPTIHRIWQVRHAIVHNNSVIDERFLVNVKKVDMLKPGERKGREVKVSKADFEQAKEAFAYLFGAIDGQIKHKELKLDLINLPF